MANGADKDDIPPLVLAIIQGCHDVVVVLLASGAHVDDRVLFCGAEQGHLAVVKALLDAGARVNATDDLGITLLIVAAGSGRLDVVKGLLDAGAELNHKDNEGKTALDHAKQEQHRGIIDYLVSRDAICEKTARGETRPTTSRPHKTESVTSDVEKLRTSLHDLSSVEQFLRSGGNPNGYKDNNGSTLLLLALVEKAIVTLPMLLATGAHVNVANNDGLTPLIPAAATGNLFTVKALLNAGSDVQH